MTGVASRLNAVRARIRCAADAAGRDPDTVALIAVSKTVAAEAVFEAMQAGQRAFGENYLQEALAKMEALEPLCARHAGVQRPEWHFTGPVQSNKTRAIAQYFDWVHGVDRYKIAQRLSEARAPSGPPLQVCVQVNVGGETSKGGVEPACVEALAREVAQLPGLRLRGLMTIPRPSDDPAAQRAQFRLLRDLRDRLACAGLALDTLSMGMSDDLEAAIAEGATLVRVGRAIFGERARPTPAP